MCIFSASFENNTEKKKKSAFIKKIDFRISVPNSQMEKATLYSQMEKATLYADKKNARGKKLHICKFFRECLGVICLIKNHRPNP